MSELLLYNLSTQEMHPVEVSEQYTAFKTTKFKVLKERTVIFEGEKAYSEPHGTVFKLAEESFVVINEQSIFTFLKLKERKPIATSIFKWVLSFRISTLKFVLRPHFIIWATLISAYAFSPNLSNVALAPEPEALSLKKDALYFGALEHLNLSKPASLPTVISKANLTQAKKKQCRKVLINAEVMQFLPKGSSSHVTECF